MKAFVQIHQDNQFWNPNYFEAWRGFRHLGYEVETFKIHEVNDIKVTKDTPVFASVEMTKQIFRRLKVKHEELSSYPEELDGYLKRNIYVQRMDKVRHLIKAGAELFIKPLDRDRKLFPGEVISEGNVINLSHLPEALEVLVCSPLKFLSEYRVCIQDGKILDSRKYRGDIRKSLDYDVIENAIKDFKSAPIAYCLDFGIDELERTTLVEVTDAWSFGHYGLDMLYYANMLINRWNEIVNGK